jgi:hypothetical protein
MLNTQMKAFRLAKLTTAHVTVQSALSSTPQSIAQIAASCGITADDAERKLSLLVDESLAARSVGTRATATYTAL